MANLGPTMMRHSRYSTRSDSVPVSENRTVETSVPGVFNTYIGRGDSVAVNGSAHLSAGKALTQNESYLQVVRRLLLMRSQLSIPLTDEVHILFELGEATWKYLAAHPYTPPQWIMWGYLMRHMLLRPWIAYRVDVGTNMLRNIRNSCPPELSEIDFEAASRHLLSGGAIEEGQERLTSSRDSRCGLVFGGLLGLRSIVAVSYARESFSSPADLAYWVCGQWNGDWLRTGIGRNAAKPSVKPFLWLDSFGMDGKSKMEKHDWAKYSPFIYSLFPVLSFVPILNRDPADRADQNDDPNTKCFQTFDERMWVLSQHVLDCTKCQDRLKSVHRQVQRQWNTLDSETDLCPYIGLHIVHSRQHMRIWPVIERTLSMRMKRLMFAAEGWEAVYSTYCLGVMALENIVRKTCACKFGSLAAEMMEAVSLGVCKGIVHQLGLEAEFAVPLKGSESQSSGLPHGRTVEPLDFARVLEAGLNRFLLHARPVLSGQVPTLQQRSERYDRRFLAMLADFEPNHYDSAMLRIAPDYNPSIEDRVSLKPQDFFPDDYVRNWLDDRQATNFGFKLALRPWYLSRLAPGLDTAPGQCYITTRVSPVLVGKVEEMCGSNAFERDPSALFVTRMPEIVCAAIPLAIEQFPGNSSGAEVGLHTSLRSLKVMPEIEGTRYVACLIRSYSHECQCKSWRNGVYEKEYIIEVMIGEAKRGVSDAIPSFTVTLVGHVVPHNNSTIVQWGLPGDTSATGSLDIGDGLRKLPLVTRKGMLISLIFATKTDSETNCNPRDHVPLPLEVNDDWEAPWLRPALRVTRHAQDAHILALTLT